MVGKKAVNSPRVMTLRNNRVMAMMRRKTPRREVCQWVKMRVFIGMGLKGECLS